MSGSRRPSSAANAAANKSGRRPSPAAANKSGARQPATATNKTGANQSAPAAANKAGPNQPAAPGVQRRQTRREQVEQRQNERKREEERQQRARLIKRVVLWGGGAAVVALIGFLIARAVISANQTAAASGPIPGVVTYSNLSHTHKTGTLTYAQNPPVGGDHNPVWLNCGVYTTPVPNENAVHSMEHGAVWITYQPNLSDKDIQTLTNLVSGHSYVILSPYPNLPAPVVASAWGVQLKVQSASDPRLARFITKYEQGPQTPEPGAACSGGVGTPNS